ncbi:hypothetical protein B9Z19DRAFT_823186 [Tuber borchii]|uniref:Uncharacterized protein n=1 Tax=Tuber borchii TaxID=42251 RepID=A0A2T7A7B2_TUBBO|nr:hypothetical protein B9Z19DRAFT_823186 [Tuber borchii]
MEDGCIDGWVRYRYSILESVGVFCSCIANVVGLVSFEAETFSFPPFLFLSHLTLFPTVRKCSMSFGCLEWFCFFSLFTFGFLLSCPCETARWSRLA